MSSPERSSEPGSRLPLSRSPRRDATCCFVAAGRDVRPRRPSDDGSRKPLTLLARDEPVVRRSAVAEVVTVLAVKAIGPLRSREDVVTPPCADAVGSAAAEDPVVATEAEDRVVGRRTADPIATLRADDVDGDAEAIGELVGAAVARGGLPRHPSLIAPRTGLRAGRVDGRALRVDPLGPRQATVVRERAESDRGEIEAARATARTLLEVSSVVGGIISAAIAAVRG